jgi:hypothetical protein
MQRTQKRPPPTGVVFIATVAEAASYAANTTKEK